MLTPFFPVLALLLGCALDGLLGEPRRCHPIVFFGHIANKVEKHTHGPDRPILRGMFAWLICVLPWLVLAAFAQQALQDHWWFVPVGGVTVYACIGWKSLAQHGLRVAEPLERGERQAAKDALRMIVSRDVSALDETGIANAASESMLENGADAIFAALFWFAILGLPGVVLYRASNTLDAMWGYKNERYLGFGKWAARVDDLLNWIPARITVLSYAMASGSLIRAQMALRCAWQQGRRWKSPNAGPVMAAGAAALGLTLGGVGIYHGIPQDRGTLGAGRSARASDIKRAITLVNRAGILWLILLVIFMVAMPIFK
ncbi:Cobalamin biosynthesis protein CobD [Halomonadaceae bacterium LMG 33818]|uniref:adenosylcobinamide-phosphate synthase CbiB n=1 Tax=Cernens ardua TaxID=3402176 RepID=UPI003EDC6288